MKLVAGPSRLVAWSVAVTTVALLACAGARMLAPAEGLKAEYYPETAWTSRPIVTRVEPFPSTAVLEDAWGGTLPQRFSIAWNGWIIAVRGGTYTLATDATQHSSVFIDGRIVLDNQGGDEPRRMSGTVTLTRGAHAVLVRYAHESGPAHLDLLWSRDDESLERVPQWALRPEKPQTATTILGLLLFGLLAGCEWIWVAALSAAVLASLWQAGRLVRRTMVRDHLWPALRWILLGSLSLNAVGVWWGLPATWPQDELTPITLFVGAAQHYSHGWFDRWPPLHYYLLTMAIGPGMLLQWFGRVDLFSGVWPVVLILVTRSVSLLAAAGIVTSVCLTGARLFGRRAGLLAAGTFALAAQFVYYAKTANLDVPYVFWFAVSLFFYVRMLDDGRLRDYVWFALTATMAICTKDQAYALYLFVPFLVLHRVWQTGSPRRSWAATLVDRRIIAAVMTAAVVFTLCHNLLFNFAGFLEHVRYIAGPGNENYRAFQPTASGRAALLLLTARLLKISWGWPLTLVSAAGIVIALREASLRRRALILLAPVVSYYLGFIDVILYNYDRFVLPICLVFAIFAGLALDRWLRWPGGRRFDAWKTAAVAITFAYSLFYAATVDALMLNDSRYSVERWIRAEAADKVIGISGPRELLPRLNCRCADIDSLALLRETSPEYYVLSADYAHAVPTDTDWGRLIAGLEQGTAGYRLVSTFRSGTPWPWLPDGHPELVGRRAASNDPNETDQFRIEKTGVFSVLRNIDPTIEVFQRAGDRPAR